MRLAKVILEELAKGRKQRTALLKSVIQTSGSPAKFESVFNWLKKDGFIVKAGRRHLDPYKITRKGRRFLAGLESEEENLI